VFVGWLASLLMGRNLSLVYAFFVGFVGSVLGGLLLYFVRPYLGYVPWSEGAGFYLASLGAGVLGAMLVLHVSGWGKDLEALIEPQHTDALPSGSFFERAERSRSSVPTEAELQTGPLILLGGVLLVAGLVLAALAIVLP
jgi:uncharacterized membrane protein YeaQ/YmgE (transglycosylase-associated protein family)